MNTQEPLEELVGPTILLRRAKMTDVPARLALGNSPEIHRMFGGSQGDLTPMTAEAAENFIRRLMDHPYAWVIDQGGFVGEVRLDRLDFQDGRASLAIGILDPGRLDKGIGTEAIRLVLKFAFDRLRLHRISVRVIQYNLRAIRSYQKCGFREEGREREAAYVDGQRYDDVMMGLLAHEFFR